MGRGKASSRLWVCEYISVKNYKPIIKRGKQTTLLHLEKICQVLITSANSLEF